MHVLHRITGKMLKIRNVRLELHEELRRRARIAGKTLSGYAREILEREVKRAPREEVFERLRGRTSVALKRPASEYIY